MSFRREPIHLGSGEPILLLHPFLCSQEVWSTVADQLADTGRFEVLAPTMVGHHGGARAGSWFLDTAPHSSTTTYQRRNGPAGLGDGAYRRQLAWRLGGLRVGTPRTGPCSLTAIAPAWRPGSSTQRSTRTVLKFLARGSSAYRGPTARPADPPTYHSRAESRPCRSAAPPTDRATPTSIRSSTTRRTARLTFSCWSKRCRLPGLLEVSPNPLHPPSWCLCEEGPRLSQPAVARVHLCRPHSTQPSTSGGPPGSTGLGHIPVLLQAPGIVSPRSIADFVDAHTEPQRQAPPPAALVPHPVEDRRHGR